MAASLVDLVRDAISDDVLQLDRALLATARIEPLAEWPALTIDGVDVDGDATSVRITGTCGFLGLESLHAIVTLERTSATVELTLPSGWSFGDSFPDLPGTLDFSPERIIAGPTDSFFYGLSVDRGAVIVSSHPDGDVVAGIQLVADLGLDGVLAPLRAGATAGSSLTVRGMLDDDGMLSLSGRLPVGLDIGPLAIGEVECELFTPLSDANEGSSSVALTLDLAVDGRPVRCRGSLDVGTSVATLEMDPSTQWALGSWTDLAHALGLGDALGPLDEIVEGTISVDWWRLALDLPRRELLDLGICVRLDHEWEIVDDRLSASDLTVEVLATDPLSSSRRSVAIAVRGRVDVAGTPIDIEARLPEFEITGTLGQGAAPSLAELASDWGLAVDDLPSDLTVSALSIAARPRDRSFSARVGLAGLWSTTIGSEEVSLDRLELAVAHRAGATSLSAAATASVAGQTVEALLAYDGGWSLSTNLADVSLSELAAAVLDEELPGEFPDIALDSIELTANPQTGQFAIDARSSSVVPIPIGTVGLAIEGLSLSVEREAGEAVHGSIAGSVRIGQNVLDVVYRFPGDFVLAGTLPSVGLSALLQELCGGDVVRDLAVPPALMSAELRNVQFELAPARRTMTLAATTDLGDVAALASPSPAGGWGFSVGFVPSSGAFGGIDPGLAGLDDLALDGAVVLSTADAELILPGRTDPIAVRRGVHLHTEIDLRGLGADGLLGVETIAASATLGSRIDDIELEAAIGGEIVLGDGVVLSEIVLRLRPSPSNFSLALLGIIDVAVGDTELQFTGVLEIAPRSAVFEGTMEGTWVEPFGFRGVALADVAVELGLSFPPPIPSVGIAAGLRIGDFVGAAAVKFDSAMPSRSMVAIAFNRLYLIDVVRELCAPAIAGAIPAELQATLLDVGFEDVEVYIVPQPTSIGELHFEPGFTIRGRMNLWGFRAAAHVNIDHGTGVYVAAACDPVELAGIFRLSGADGRPGPSLMLDLRTGQTPKVDIQGAIELLGLRVETVLQITDDGFWFSATGRIFDLFEATVIASGDDLAKGDNFRISVRMHNDLLTYLRDRATQAIAAAAEAATRELQDAQADLRRTQGEVDRLGGEIDRMRQAVGVERARDRRALDGAVATLDAEQARVNRLNAQIAATRNTINAERKRDADRLAAARRDLTRAQGDVNSLQVQINSAHARIATLRNEIRNWQNWYNRLAWYDKAWGWTRLGAETGWRNAEIGAQYTRIGAVEVAKATANTALEVAKGAVSAIASTAKTFPVDADPRVVGLLTQLGAATAAIEVAKAAVRAARDLVKAFPVDADPRVASLIVARGTATAGLVTATSFLRGVEAAVGGAAQVGTFIAQAGLGGLLDVRSAGFESELGAAAGGSVLLSLDLVFMNEAHHLQLAFTFHDPVAAIGDLVTRLLPA